MSIMPVRHRFSVDDYEQMGAYGILTENDRVELIRGEIVEKMTIGPEHAACVKRLNRLLGPLVGPHAIVSIQDPIRFPDSEPEPDVALLVPRDDFYSSGNPGPSDVLLLIEVADTTLDVDRGVKRTLYAESGIHEYWIVNLPEASVEVHRQPSPDGQYQYVRVVTGGDQIEIAALPGLLVAVDQIL
jgi:Uma2 family endonuclease